jgi:hypothetical protein
LAAGALLVFGAVADAGQEPVLESTQARRATALAARANLGRPSVSVVGVATVQVVGFAWNADHTPVAYPLLRIRDLQDGLVVANATGTELGEFRFNGLSGGSYLIELVDASDGVLAVGQPLSLLPGETVNTFIVLVDVDGMADRFALAGGTGAQRFDESAPAVVQAATGAQVSPIGGGNNAASNER